MLSKKISEIEWLAFLSFVGMVVTLISISIYGREKKLLHYPKAKNKVVLYINGAVENPGEYVFDKSIFLKELLEKAQVKKNANIKLLKPDRKIYKSVSIYVPFKDLKN
jgi:hypothetical protein